MQNSIQSCQVALVYHEMYNGRGFSRVTRSWGRYRAGLDKLAELGLVAPAALDNIANIPAGTGPRHSSFIPVFRSIEASPEQLATVHTPAHIQHVQEMDARGEGYFDRNDTPAWPGVYRRAALAVGGTLLSAELVA